MDVYGVTNVWMCFKCMGVYGVGVSNVWMCFRCMDVYGFSNVWMSSITCMGSFPPSAPNEEHTWKAG
jgi:hypothetical protein